MEQIPLVTWGWHASVYSHFQQLNDPTLEPARVLAQHRGWFDVITGHGSRMVRASQKLWSHVEAGAQRPVAVGDFVALDVHGQLTHVLPATGVLARKAAGRTSTPQVMAANIDELWLVTSLTEELNAQRMQRYALLAADAGVPLRLVLSKADLCPDPALRLEGLSMPGNGPVHVVSTVTGAGLPALAAHLVPGQTVALMGSSGVGKSTLLNALGGAALAPTSAVSHQQRGRHTTTGRQMHMLAGGALVVDTPGMRELALWMNESQAVASMEDVAALATGCRFADCQHLGEPGCAVAQAQHEGALAPERVTAFHKLKREARHLEARVNPELARSEKANRRALTAMAWEATRHKRRQ